MIFTLSSLWSFSKVRLTVDPAVLGDGCQAHQETSLKSRTTAHKVAGVKGFLGTLHVPYRVACRMQRPLPSYSE